MYRLMVCGHTLVTQLWLLLATWLGCWAAQTLALPGYSTGLPDPGSMAGLPNWLSLAPWLGCPTLALLGYMVGLPNPGSLVGLPNPGYMVGLLHLFH